MSSAWRRLAAAVAQGSPCAIPCGIAPIVDSRVERGIVLHVLSSAWNDQLNQECRCVFFSIASLCCRHACRSDRGHRQTNRRRSAGIAGTGCAALCVRAESGRTRQDARDRRAASRLSHTDEAGAELRNRHDQDVVGSPGVDHHHRADELVGHAVATNGMNTAWAVVCVRLRRTSRPTKAGLNMSEQFRDRAEDQGPSGTARSILPPMPWPYGQLATTPKLISTPIS